MSLHCVPLSLRVWGPEELWTVKLGLKLLAERIRFQTSQWRPYIQNLPKRFTVPIFYTAEEIRALQYLPLTNQVEKRIKFLSEFAMEAMPAIIGEEAPQLDHHPFRTHRILPHALAWSMAAVSSRAFHVHNAGGGSSLLPLVDMCNHSFAPTGHLVQHSSSSPSLPALEVTMGGAELVEGRLLAAVRLMHAQEDATTHANLEALQVWHDHQTHPLGVANERKAIRTLIGLGMLALTSFPTVIQEVESDLGKGGISENLRLAIQFRMLKKRLLVDTIQGLKARYPA